MASWTPETLGDTLEQFPLGVALLTTGGEVFYANKALVKVTHHEAFELMGEGFYNLVFPTAEINDRLRQKVLTAAEAPFDDLDLTAELGPDRERRSFHFCGGPVAGPQGPFLALVIQDVTHRKAFEKVIESSFDNFIQVTNALDAAMKKIGEQNTILEDYKEKMTRELAIAKGVQKAIIPREFPRHSGFDLFGLAIPTDELGGDYFDWFQVDDDRFGMLIADVSGHGVPSSLITTMVKSSFDYHTKKHPDPATVLTEVNRDLTAIIADTGFYLTALYGVLNPATREFRVAVAGHDSALCLEAGNLRRLGGGGEGTILGVFPEAVYTSRTYFLAPGARVLAYTDGITEARSPSGEFFGTGRLESFLASQGNSPAQNLVEALVEVTNRFFDTAVPNDDRTLWAFSLPGGEIPPPEDSLLLAKKAFAAKDFPAAHGLLGQVLEAGDRSAEVCYLAGQTLVNLGKGDQAAEFFEEAVRTDPRFTKAWYYLGLVRHNLGDRAGARTAWVRVRELDENYKDIKKLLSVG